MSEKFFVLSEGVCVSFCMFMMWVGMVVRLRLMRLWFYCEKVLVFVWFFWKFMVVKVLFLICWFINVFLRRCLILGG